MPQYRVIVSYIGGPGFGPNIYVYSEFIDVLTSPESSAGVVPIPVACTDANDTLAIEAAYPTALAAWCTMNSIVTPTNVFWTKNGAVIPQSQVVGLTTALGLKANTSSLATVATTGDYNDLINKPTIPTSPASYQAIISQTGTSAPTGSTLVNTYSGTPTMTLARTGAGVYTITASSAVFSTTKTGIFIQPLTNLNGALSAVVTSTTVITITTAIQSLAVLGLLGFTAVPTDALLNKTMIYVQTYP